MITPEKNSSVWSETEAMPQFPSLEQDVEIDVCIVGGGIAGLTTAYLLTLEGKSVCLLESAELCSGQTSRTTAHFSTVLDDRYFNLERYHGREGARLAFESHSQAIEKVKSIIKSEQIDCELEMLDGYLFASDVARRDVLKKELKAAHRAGLKEAVMLDYCPLHSFDAGSCIKFSHQMKLHPLKYLKALSSAISREGGKIYTHTHVLSVEGGDEAIVKTKNGFSVKTRSIVMATNSPINDRLVIHTKQAAYRSYVLGFKIPKGSIKNALYWDTLESYHYLRVDKLNETHDQLIVGGADHKTGQDDHTESHFDELETWVRTRFPSALELTYKWSGQVMEPVDALAFLGRNPMDSDNVYVITGDSGNGMTHCTIGGMLVTDLIMKRANPWIDLYSPNRISLSSLPHYLKENTNVLAQYTEWLASKATPDFDSLLALEGVVFRDGLKMLAGYKNANGEMSFVSAACSHLGGIVHWNEVEKSWDCPCHGSRFNASGVVIEGPALTDLEKQEPMLENRDSLSLDFTDINAKIRKGDQYGIDHQTLSPS